MLKEYLFLQTLQLVHVNVLARLRADNREASQKEGCLSGSLKQLFLERFSCGNFQPPRERYCTRIVFNSPLLRRTPKITQDGRIWELLEIL